MYISEGYLEGNMVHGVLCASWGREKGTMCCMYDTGNGGSSRAVVEGEWSQNWSDTCCSSCEIDDCLFCL